MTLDRDIDRRIRDFYTSEVPALPDHVRLAVHEAVVGSPRHAFSARRSWGRRSWFTLAVVVLAVIGAAVVGRGLRQPSVIVGPGPSASPVVVQPSPSPSPTAPTPAPEPTPPPSVALGPGRVGLSIGDIGASVDIPAGWQSTLDGSAVIKSNSGDDPPEVKLWILQAINKSPCDLPYLTRGVSLRPDPGGIATAFLETSGYTVSDVEQIEVDGWSGWTLDIKIPDTWGGCAIRSMNLWVGSDGGKVDEPGDHDRLWILDVNGQLVVADAFWHGSAPGDEAEVDAILRTLEFVVSPTPSPSESTDPSAALIQHHLEVDSVAVTVMSPPGWEGTGPIAVTNGSLWSSQAARLRVMDVGVVFTDPCASPALNHGPVDGDGVADLAREIHAANGPTTTPDRPTQVDGFDGVTFDLAVPDDLHQCQGSLLLWVGEATQMGFAGDRHRIAIVDVDSHRLLIDAQWASETTPEDQAALLEMARTIHLEPPSPVASDSPPVDPDTGLVRHDLEMDPFTVTVLAPPGWVSPGSFAVNNGTLWTSSAARLKITRIGSVFRQPCANPFLIYSNGTGESVEALSRQIHDAAGYVKTPAVPTTVDGFDGVTFDLSVPADLSHCDHPSLMLWADPIGSTETAFPGEGHRVILLDVGGHRLVIDAQWAPEATPDDQAELLEMLRTITIETS